MKSLKTAAICLGTCLALFALPALALDVVESGPDMWSTAGKGTTYTSFGSDPIPADFFCPGSQPFTGRVAMRGEPLATEPAGVLGATDTIVHRLDNAEFDANGVATTRIRLMALSLASSDPIDVGCAERYSVKANLDGAQPTTEMKIIREVENGGSYVAPLALEVKLSFIPENGGETRTLHRRIDLGPGTHSVWTTTNKGRMMGDGSPVIVDTDGDDVADTALPKPSRFIAGVAPVDFEISPRPDPGTLTGITPISLCPRGTCPHVSCHCKPEDSFPAPEWDEPGDNCAEDHLHCVNTCAPCNVIVIGVGGVGSI